jgi:hypothetical protein
LPDRYNKEDKVMSVYRKSLLQVLPLILLLLAGQLQAKTVCLCSMMDKNTHSAMMNIDKDIQDEETCCHDHNSLDCDDTTSLSTDSCPKNIFDVSINQDIQINIPIPDLLIESDVEPSQIKFTTLDFVFPSQIVAPSIEFSSISHARFGSKIHLITQRLRI